jgi:hypothetical protein
MAPEASTQSAELATFYLQAFELYRSRALRNLRLIDDPRRKTLRSSPAHFASRAICKRVF